MQDEDESDDIQKLVDESTDDLNRALEEAEDALREMRLGVTAKVLLCESPVMDLAFKKLGMKRWGLVVLNGDQETTLRNTSRRTRVTAVGVLTALREALLAAVDQNLAEIEQATREARRFALETRELVRRK